MINGSFVPAPACPDFLRLLNAEHSLIERLCAVDSERMHRRLSGRCGMRLSRAGSGHSLSSLVTATEDADELKKYRLTGPVQ